MNNNLSRRGIGVLWAIFAIPVAILSGEQPIVIAHRGASGYLPEHTLEAKALAYGMGADYVEQDVVLSKDDCPLVLHDIHLDTVTNVAKAFPQRHRSDGRYYAIDFTLAEIKSLRVTERIDLDKQSVVYPKRFPPGKSEFRVPTLQEEIELIQGLNKTTSNNVGIYSEIKSPAWHRQQGKDISRIVLDVLDKHGYRDRTANIFVQCFDPKETRRIRENLHCNLKLVQLIADNDWNEAPVDFDQLRTPLGIKRIAEYADGVGVWMPHIVEGRDAQGNLIVNPIVQIAHEHGLKVHPFTFRADSLPEYAKSFDEVLRIFLVDVGVDGIFTDFPDRAVLFRAKL